MTTKFKEFTGPVIQKGDIEFVERIGAGAVSFHIFFSIHISTSFFKLNIFLESSSLERSRL